MSNHDHSPDDLRRLREENETLRHRIQRLTRENEYFDRRLERMEASVLFRSLRQVGHVFDWVRSRFQGESRNSRLHENDQDYATWARQTALFESWRVAHRQGDGAPQKRLTFVIDAREYNLALLKRTISSIGTQGPIVSRVFISTRDIRENLEEFTTASCSRIEIATDQDVKQSFRRILDRVQDDFIVVASPGAIFEPGAGQRWLEATRPDTIASYSDWDQIAPDGQRHRPRFTPELSPELLLHGMYWGRCFLVRTSELRAMRWPPDDATLPWEHDLALRLAERKGSIVRIPRMLWHLEDDAASNDLNLSAVRLALDRRNEKAEVMQESSNPAIAKLRRVPCSDRASIIICSRRSELLEQCLASLGTISREKHELIVVIHRINGNAGLAPIAAKYGARTVDYEGAFHFGLMNQQGVDASTGSTLVLLNDDVQPLTEEWLDSMLAQAARPEIGVVGAVLLYPDGSVQHAGIVVGDSYVPAHAGRFGGESSYWPWLKLTREVSAVTGACLAIRRAVWDELGGFDWRFPVNYNDVDLCLRAAQHGYRVLIDGRAVLRHAESQTRKAMVRASERQLFWDRWHTLQDSPDPFFNPQLVIEDERIRLLPPSITDGGIEN